MRPEVDAACTRRAARSCAEAVSSVQNPLPLPCARRFHDEAGSVGHGNVSCGTGIMRAGAEMCVRLRRGTQLRQVTVLAVYGVVLLAIGFWARKETKSVAGYSVAGKKLPSWVIAFSSNTTGESAWLLLGLTGMALPG